MMDKEQDTVISGWVCRDADGTLVLFYEGDKPYKEDGYNSWSAVHGDVLESLPQDIFPDVTWKDEEPIEVELIIKRKKK